MDAATVTARGQSVVPGRPDEGIWTIAVSALSESPEAALNDVGGRSRSLEELLEDLGVAPEKRSTTGVNVREEFDWADGKQLHRGFRAENVLTVRLADPAIAGRLIQESIARAAANVRGPVWWIAPDNPARVEACRRAAAEARRKAEAYAEALGLGLGAVVEVREPPPPSGAFPRARVLAAAAEAPPVDVDPGDLDVEANVEVTFRLDG
ncbi:MAG TPA: SIMPL domain-containing protein [Actinomycetota bacterium]|nr:SIMPL domain-containing protein [Actinomycetota bacterium]